MAIDFVRTPGPEHEPKIKLDYWKPELEKNIEEQYLQDKAKLEADKAAFEEEKRLSVADSIEKEFSKKTKCKSEMKRISIQKGEKCI